MLLEIEMQKPLVIDLSLSCNLHVHVQYMYMYNKKYSLDMCRLIKGTACTLSAMLFLPLLRIKHYHLSHGVNHVVHSQCT